MRKIKKQAANLQQEINKAIKTLSNSSSKSDKQLVKLVQDVTAYQKKIESEADNLFRTTLYSIGDAVITTDKDGLIMNMNPVAEKLTGWKESASVNKPLEKVFRIINEVTRKKVQNPVRNVLKANSIVGLANHTILISKKGKEIPIADSGAPIRSRKDEIIGVVLVFRDQSKERIAKRELEEKEKRYRELFESNPHPMWIYDLKTLKFLEVNDAAVEHYGYSRNEFLKMTIKDIRPKEEVKKLYENISKVTKGIDQAGIWNHRLKNGELIRVQIVSHTLQYKNRPAEMVLANDITKRLQVEAKLRESEEKYRLLVETQTDLVVKVDTKGRFKYVSPSYCKLFGKKESELIGKSFIPLVHEDDVEATRNAMKSLYRKPYACYIEQRAMTSIGWRWLAWSDNSILNEKNEIIEIVGVGRDITDKKKSEEIIRQQYYTLAGINESLNSSIYSIDKNMIYTSFNSAHASSMKLLYNSKIEIGKNILDYITDTHHKVNTKKKLEKVLKGNYFVEESYANNRYQSGFYLETSYNPIFEEKGKVIGAAVVVRDLTYRKGIEEELKAKNKNLNSLLNISLKLLDSLDKTTVLQRIVESATELNAMDSGAIYSLRDNELFLDASTPPLPANMPNEFRKARLENHPYIKKAIQNQSPITISNVKKVKLSNEEKLIMKTKGFTSLLYIPLAVEKRVNGILILGKIGKEHAFSEQEIDLSRTFAGIASLVLENANLFEKSTTNIAELNQLVLEKNRAANELKNSEERYRKLFENHSAVKLVIDPDDGKILDANPSAEKFYGWTKSELNRKNIFEINTMEHNELTKLMSDALAGTKSNFEFQHKRADGSIKNVEVFTSNIEIQGKNLIHSIIHDITEKKIAEDQIRLLGRSIEQSPVIVIITDPKGNIIYVNPKFTEVTGYSFEDVKGKNPKILNSGKQSKEFYQNLWQTILSGNNWRGEFQNRKKNGELYWEDAIISPIVNDRQIITNFVGVKEDITDKKKMLEDLIIAKENAEEMNRVKSFFFANMSHELRTPLWGLSGYAELMLSSSTNPEERELAQGVLNSAKRLTNTLTSILNLTKLEFDSVEVINDIINVSELISDVCHDYNMMAANKNLEIIQELFFDKIEIKSDENLLRGILNNLISNAIKYTENGYVKVSAKIEAESKNEILLIEIIDTGIGIPANKIDLIWKPFRQASEGVSRDFQGTGLGLTIVKKYTELLKGKIFVKSKEGLGSSFLIELPI